ncbi:MAG: sulfur carrier protein ThiS [Desulforhopalus sp.]|nr:sulfur carrier protein ThiS [Desulforhopalus sp.]
MELVINGQREICSAGTVDTLVADKGLPPESLVVELNGTIIRQADWPAIRLHDGDTLELLSFVGGG